MEKVHKPSEFFGFPPENKDKIALETQKKFWCPFLNKLCTKQTRLLKYPLGACSVWHMGEPYIICPSRFYFNEFCLIKHVGQEILKTEKVEIINEVKLKGFGTLDWVAFSLNKDGNEIENFCGIEIQSDSTTQTGKIVEAIVDFFNNKLKDKYNYGLNTYNTIKLSFTQMMNKGQVFESWDRKYVWVVQDVLFQNFSKRFDLKLKEGTDDKKSIVFQTVKMVLNKGNVFDIELDKKYSASISDLLYAYRRKSLPDVNDFKEKVISKFKTAPIDFKFLAEQTKIINF